MDAVDKMDASPQGPLFGNVPNDLDNLPDGCFKWFDCVF